MRSICVPLAVLGVVSLFASCTGPDPAAIEVKERVPLSSSGAISSSGGSGSSGGSSGTSSGDGGASSGDGGMIADPNIMGAYASAPPTGNKHKTGTNPMPLTSTNNCNGCHSGGGNPQFFTGGVVYQKKGDTTTKVADAEVWINDGTTKIKVNTDTDGAFWFRTPTAGATFPASVKTSIRTKEGKVVTMGMIGAGGQGCNSTSCHGGAGTGPIYIDP